MNDLPSPLPVRRALFTARTTLLVRLGLLGILLAASLATFSVYEYYHSSYWSRIGLAPDQPVLFSHRHHAGELRIDCRFCHPGVETNARAGLPPTRTCLTCHSQLFADAPLLRPIMTSAVENRPLAWSRVTAVPDHVHFNHAIHVTQGIACANCHGDMTTMALAAKARALTMRDCLECHRDPTARQVAETAIFTAHPSAVIADVSSGWRPPVNPRPLTNCSTCHY